MRKAGPPAFHAIEIYGAYLFEGNAVSKQRNMELLLLDHDDDSVRETGDREIVVRTAELSN